MTCSPASATASASAEGVAGVGGEMGVVSGLDGAVEDVDDVIVLFQAHRQYPRRRRETVCTVDTWYYHVSAMGGR